MKIEPTPKNRRHVNTILRHLNTAQHAQKVALDGSCTRELIELRGSFLRGDADTDQLAALVDIANAMQHSRSPHDIQFRRAVVNANDEFASLRLGYP